MEARLGHECRQRAPTRNETFDLLQASRRTYVKMKSASRIRRFARNRARLGFGLLQSVMMKRVLVDHQFDQHGEIRLAIFPAPEPRLCNLLRESLLVVEALDPRRYDRIASHADWIIAQSVILPPYSARYNGWNRSIEVHLATDPSIGDHLFHTVFFAGALVHEATHGALEEKFGRTLCFPCEDRLQMERICRAEENRFLRRAEHAHKGRTFQRPFEAQAWIEMWARCKRVGTIQTLRDVYRAASQAARRPSE